MEKKDQKKSHAPVVIIAALILLVIFLGIALIGANSKNGNQGISQANNADGTSKTQVYTKIADFGNYSDWAQQQVKQGFSMCSLQNVLAQSDPNVSVVQDCDSKVECNSTTAGINTSTVCQKSKSST